MQHGQQQMFICNESEVYFRQVSMTQRPWHDVKGWLLLADLMELKHLQL